MTLNLINAVGSESANTYATLDEANDFTNYLVLSDDNAAWSAADDPDKQRALFTAAQRIDRERFLGAKVNEAQALEWPRSGVKKPGTYNNVYTPRNLGEEAYPYRLVQSYYADDEIPDRVKHAQIILAVYLNNNRNGMELSGLEDFASVSVGSLNVTPRFYGAVGIDRIPPIVDHYLMGIRIGGRANLPIKRS